MKKLFIYLLLITALLTSCKQSENNSNSYEDTPTMQLKDAGQEIMNGRNIQDSIDNIHEERTIYNSFPEEQEQVQEQVQVQEQPQHAKMIICPNCNGTGEAYKKCDHPLCQNGVFSGGQTCGVCDGTGQILRRCKVCGGQGRVKEYE